MPSLLLGIILGFEGYAILRKIRRLVHVLGKTQRFIIIRITYPTKRGK